MDAEKNCRFSVQCQSCVRACSDLDSTKTVSSFFAMGFWNSTVSLLAVPLTMLVYVSFSPAARAEVRGPGCSGTVLQLSVQERGETRIDRFRFTLRLEAEGSSAAVALDQFNRRLQQLRIDLRPLVQGDLEVPAPNTFPISPSQSPDRFRVSTTIRGSVSRSNYDMLIQRAGRLPGVRLQGMTSLASAQGQTELEERLLKRALKRGQSQAASMASALGLDQVKLLRIDQRSQPATRGLATAATAAPQFRPGEAPRPTGSLSLTLGYCLS